MSHLQGVVFIAVICAVNAAVTVNVYEDDVETITANKAHEVESCNTEGCELICRLLGFDVGICVGDTCECKKSHKDDDQLKQNNIPSLGEGVSEKELGACNPNACYQLCRRLKFPSGTCINGRCKCDNFRPEPEAMDYGVLQVQAGCNNAACSTLCHILGYRYGVCINSNTCKCSNLLRTDVLKISLDQGINEYIANVVEPDVDTVVTKAVRDCDQVACMMRCLELGAPGGSCFSGKCRCNKREAMDNGVRDQVQIGCSNAGCSTLCHILGYRYGVCTDSNTCECTNL